MRRVDLEHCSEPDNSNPMVKDGKKTVYYSYMGCDNNYHRSLAGKLNEEGEFNSQGFDGPEELNGLKEPEQISLSK